MFSEARTSNPRKIDLSTMYVDIPSRLLSEPVSDNTYILHIARQIISNNTFDTIVKFGVTHKVVELKLMGCSLATGLNIARLMTCKNISSLDLSGTPLTLSQLTSLCTVYSNNSTLIKLNLDNTFNFLDRLEIEFNKENAQVPKPLSFSQSCWKVFFGTTEDAITDEMRHIEEEHQLSRSECYKELYSAYDAVIKFLQTNKNLLELNISNNLPAHGNENDLLVIYDKLCGFLLKSRDSKLETLIMEDKNLKLSSVAISGIATRLVKLTHILQSNNVNLKRVSLGYNCDELDAELANRKVTKPVVIQENMDKNTFRDFRIV